MICGTSYFVSFVAAIEYYDMYYIDEEAVAKKIERGEIHIGIPPHNPEFVSVVLLDDGLRYGLKNKD